MNYWLLKTEPSTFGIEDLERASNQTTSWEGVRNYQARNILRDQMRKGDRAFFYHSSCKTPGIVGIVSIIKEGYPDLSAFNSHSPYYDPKSDTHDPRWFMIDVKLLKKFPQILTLSALKQNPALKGMQLLKQGNRLSVLPVTMQQWQAILEMLPQQ